MEYDLVWLKKILEEKKFDIDKKMLRFSLINNDSGFVFSEFYNFESNKEIISFLKNIIIPSAAISILTEENGQLVITIESSKEFLSQLHKFYAEENLINKCKIFYEKLENLSSENDKKLIEIIDEINYEFSEGHMIMLSVEYSKNVQTYLKNIYQEYKNLKKLDVLEQELMNINFCMEDFKNICKNIEKYKKDLKGNLLDKLPY